MNEIVGNSCNKREKRIRANMVRNHIEGENIMMFFTPLQVKSCIVVITMIFLSTTP